MKSKPLKLMKLPFALSTRLMVFMFAQIASLPADVAITTVTTVTQAHYIASYCLATRLMYHITYLVTANVRRL